MSQITFNPFTKKFDFIGDAGTPGVGVPTGGVTGQVLGKVSDADYDTAWIDQTGGGGSVTLPYPNFVRSVLLIAGSILSIKASTGARISSGTSQFTTISKIVTVNAGGTTTIQALAGMTINGS